MNWVFAFIVTPFQMFSSNYDSPQFKGLVENSQFTERYRLDRCLTFIHVPTRSHRSEVGTITSIATPDRANEANSGYRANKAYLAYLLPEHQGRLVSGVPINRTGFHGKGVAPSDYTEQQT